MIAADKIWSIFPFHWPTFESNTKRYIQKRFAKLVDETHPSYNIEK